MTADDNVFDAQNIDCKLQHRGNLNLNERQRWRYFCVQITRQVTAPAIHWQGPAVRAAYPQIFRILLGCEFLKNQHPGWRWPAPIDDYFQITVPELIRHDFLGHHPVLILKTGVILTFMQVSCINRKSHTQAGTAFLFQIKVN
jgi:hypothetical protein